MHFPGAGRAALAEDGSHLLPRRKLQCERSPLPFNPSVQPVHPPPSNPFLTVSPPQPHRPSMHPHPTIQPHPHNQPTIHPSNTHPSNIKTRRPLTFEFKPNTLTPSVSHRMLLSVRVVSRPQNHGPIISEYRFIAEETTITGAGGQFQDHEVSLRATSAVIDPHRPT